MEIKNQLKEMFQMQRTLNKNILDEFGEEAMTEEKLELAIIDELGELTHELKGDWCWWKKSQAPVNRQRVLEELVYVYHFVMTSEMMRKYSSTDEVIDNILNRYEFPINHFNELRKERLDCVIGDISVKVDKLGHLLHLTECLKFSFDEIYQEYLRKNNINYERLKNRY